MKKIYSWIMYMIQFINYITSLKKNIDFKNMKTISKKNIYKTPYAAGSDNEKAYLRMLYRH
jgi:hypothetical protein